MYVHGLLQAKEHGSYVTSLSNLCSKAVADRSQRIGRQK